jgi:hypothetical protein
MTGRWACPHVFDKMSQRRWAHQLKEEVTVCKPSQPTKHELILARLSSARNQTSRSWLARGRLGLARLSFASQTCIGNEPNTPIVLSFAFDVVIFDARCDWLLNESRLGNSSTTKKRMKMIDLLGWW